MSAEAVRVVEQIQGSSSTATSWRCWATMTTDRRIRQTLAELAQPDFEVAMVGPGYLPEAARPIGLEGFREAWLDWTSPFESFRIEVERVIDAGDRVVSLVRQIGRTKTGGVEIEASAAAVWTIRDGKLTRVEFHLDREAALAGGRARVLELVDVAVGEPARPFALVEAVGVGAGHRAVQLQVGGAALARPVACAAVKRREPTPCERISGCTASSSTQAREPKRTAWIV